MWSSANLTTSTPHGTLSRLYHAACTLSVYASQPGSPPDHATLDSGWWPALTGQGSHLLGRVEGFRHVYPSTWLSPSPSFAWRNKFWFHSLRNCCTVVERKLMLPTSLTKRLVNDARLHGVTEGYAAAWTMDQLRDAAQKIADRIDKLIASGAPVAGTPRAAA